MVILAALWAIMFVILLLATGMIYADARRRGLNAELWILVCLMSGIPGLVLMVVPSITPSLPVVLACSTYGSLLVILGPLVYLISIRFSGGAGGAGGEEA